MIAAPRHLRRRPGLADALRPMVVSRRTRAAAGTAVTVPAVVGGSALAAAPAQAATPAPTAAPTAARVMAAAAAPTAAQVLRYGSSGPLVKVLQQRLGKLTADGQFGAKTAAAVKAFQRSHKLVADGVVGALTWTALGGLPGSTPSGGSTGGGTTGGSGSGSGGSSGASCTVSTTLRYGAKGTPVKTLQKALGGLSVDGVFGAKTLAAVKKFQTGKKLPVTGTVDAATWKALGCTLTSGSTGGTGSGGGTGSSGGGTGGTVGDPDSPYRLPWQAGVSYRVSQGAHGKFSHNGVYDKYAVDFALPRGTQVLASRAGVVKKSGWISGGGNYVLIQDASGFCQEYFHLSSSSVRAGQKVAQGSPIARSGNTGHSTGPHLHFQMVNCSTWKAVAVVDTYEEGTSYVAGEWATSRNG